MNENNPTGSDSDLFGSLVLSLAAAALAYLGRNVMPGSDKKEADLPMARQTIDTLSMLEKKTEGNRTPDETSLLSDLLHDLRLAFVKAESAPPEAKPAEKPADKPAEPPPQNPS